MSRRMFWLIVAALASSNVASLTVALLCLLTTRSVQIEAAAIVEHLPVREIAEKIVAIENERRAIETQQMFDRLENRSQLDAAREKPMSAAGTPR